MSKETENRKKTGILVITGGGRQFCGIDSYLCSHFSRFDRTKLHTDFLFCGKNSFVLHEGAYDDNEASFYELGLFSTGRDAGLRQWLQFMPKMRAFLKEHPYHAAEVNIGSEHITALCGIVLKLSRVPVRIAHSHTTTLPKEMRHGIRELFKSAVSPVSQLINRLCFTDCAACSEIAGIQLFGREIARKGRLRVFKNAIDTGKFAYNGQKRTEIRQREGVGENTAVYCAVGRITEQKIRFLSLTFFLRYIRKMPIPFFGLSETAICSMKHLRRSRMQS